jgi:hypothetical protein
VAGSRKAEARAYGAAGLATVGAREPHCRNCKFDGTAKEKEFSHKMEMAKIEMTAKENLVRHWIAMARQRKK